MMMNITNLGTMVKGISKTIVRRRCVVVNHTPLFRSIAAAGLSSAGLSSNSNNNNTYSVLTTKDTLTTKERRCQYGTPTCITTSIQQHRWMSSSSSSSSSTSVFPEPEPPDQLTPEMAAGIADTTQFYIRYGVSNQRLKVLATNTTLPLLQKWQAMMEIFLTTQVHVLTGMGYEASEQGLTKYAMDLSECIQNTTDTTMQELLRDTRRDIWREIVATAFDLKINDIPTLSIVDARNIMHKVASKMMEPDVLSEIEQRVAIINDPNIDIELAKRHAVLQDIIVNRVYLGGTPSIVEEAGLGSDETAYAKLQCAMSDYEGDPLIAQYASAAMVKIWTAAGLDTDAINETYNTNNNPDESKK